MQTYAEKYFGITNFTPPERMLMDNGIYDESAHGLNSWYYKYIDECVNDDITTLTIQFYADAPMIIESHIIEYKLQKIEGGYKFSSSEIIYKSPYEPMYYAL